MLSYCEENHVIAPSWLAFKSTTAVYKHKSHIRFDCTAQCARYCVRWLLWLLPLPLLALHICCVLNWQHTECVLCVHIKRVSKKMCDWNTSHILTFRQLFSLATRWYIASLAVSTIVCIYVLADFYSCFFFVSPALWFWLLFSRKHNFYFTSCFLIQFRRDCSVAAVVVVIFILYIFLALSTRAYYSVGSISTFKCNLPLYSLCMIHKSM